MMTNQAEEIVNKVLNKLTDAFGTEVSQGTALAVAKSLGYVRGKRGREGGTLATVSGLHFAGLDDLPLASHAEDNVNTEG